MSRRISSIHPLFFAVFPALALAASNTAAVSAAEAWPALALSLAGTIVVWCLVRPLLGTWPKAAVMTSLVAIVFFSYTPVHRALEGWFPIRTRYALPALAVFLALAFWAIRRGEEPETLGRALTFVSGFLVLFSLGRLLLARGNGVARGTSPRPAASRPSAAAAAGLPDVYYVILDGYAGSDVLREIFGFDNHEFLDALRARGFYVADRSRSNYSQTPLSLASSTNTEYLSRGAEAPGHENRELEPLYRMIEDSRVLRSFQERGYRAVTFQSGWTVTARNRNADWDVNCGGWSEFARVLARTTILESFGLFDAIEVQTRNRVLCEFATLPEITRRIPGPRYVFAHIVSPEPPLLFRRDGDLRPPSKGDPYQEWSDRQGYVDQILFINRSVLAVVDRILADAATPPVIVLQGDHGSAALSYEWLYEAGGSPTTGNEPGIDGALRERMSILNAYHLPGGPEGLYPSISPVNSFRVIRNRVFGETNTLLTDRSYFSRYAFPFQWIDVTDRTATAAGAPAPTSSAR